MNEIKKLKLENGSHIAYKKADFHSAVSVVFFGGFMSKMHGTKASALFSHCVSNHINCTVFDYFGHGSSSGEFRKCTVSDWLKSCTHVIESLTSGPLIIVGSSMGGWLMLLVAVLYPGRIHGLVGLAAAPDFTESLDLSESERREIFENGEATIHKWECSYLITRDLIENGKEHLVLTRDKIDASCPMVLIHGMNDRIVPYQTSLAVAEKVTSENVEVLLLKTGDHYLSDEKSLKIIFETTHELIQQPPLENLTEASL